MPHGRARDGVADPCLRPRCAQSLGATRANEEVAPGRELRAARLQAIRADIAANLQDCGLSVAPVAARQGVTPRYIHRLFEGEDITFAELKAVGDERKGPNDD